MLGSHENLCEISLNISLERIIFVNFYIYNVEQTAPYEGVNSSKKCELPSPPSLFLPSMAYRLPWEAMWQSEKIMGLGIRNSPIYKTYSKLIKLSGSFFL